MTYKTQSLVKTACIALTLSMTTATVFTMSAEPAFAERGGNGNGNGRGNSSERGNSNDRGNSSNRNNHDTRNADRASSDNNGRGHLARELRGFNAAHANPNALANASPNSMPGKLSVYKQAQEEFAGVVAIQDDAYAEYQRLIELTEAEVAAEFPDGGYEDAVTTAATVYQAAREDAVEAQTSSAESLAALTGGEELSDEALGELWRLLGL